MISSYRDWKAEACRCLFCFDAPCRQDCPAGVDAPGFIRRAMQDNLRGAYDLIYRENPLSWICGVLCPTEKLCASRCPRREMDRPIAVGALQAFVSDGQAPSPIFEKERNGGNRRVAIAGAGPAGITAALSLAGMGIPVDLFEAEDLPGGLITYGIRPDKVDKKKVLHEIGRLLSRPKLSVYYNTPVSDPHGLLRQYEAVYVATGLRAEKPDPRASGCRNVLPAIAFLKEVNKAHLKGDPLVLNPQEPVVVIGGGNTAIDAAVAARLSGASEVSIVYRRTEKEMPAWQEEVEAARRRGVRFHFLLEPFSYQEKNGRIERVVFRPMGLGKVGADGRREVGPVKGAKTRFEVGTVLFATGRERELPWEREGEPPTPDKDRREPGNLFTGGDLRHGSGLIVKAVADGKRAALEIMKILTEQSN